MAKNSPKRKKKNNYIRHTLYLRNSLAYDHDLWYTCVKWWFSFFIFFLILIFRTVSEVKGQKIAQNEKQQLHASLAISQEQYTILSWFLVRLCKILKYPVVFFHFFKILIFWVVSEVKEQKMAQNDKTFCLSHSICQEKYSIRFSFMVHMCKIKYLQVVFSFFQNFHFPGC